MVIKKLVSLIMALIMLMSLMIAPPVSAADANTWIEGNILNSIYEGGDNGYCLAFFVTANVSGMGLQPGSFSTADYTNATVEYNGATASVKEMGVMFTNQEGLAPEQLYVGAEVGIESIIRIPAVYLYEEPQADACVYAARIITIPDFARDCVLTARPYFILEVDGATVTVYSDVDCESYLNVWGENHDATIDRPRASVDLGVKVTLDVDTSYSLDSRNWQDILMSVDFTVKNDSAFATDVGSTYEYVCYDANGDVIQTAEVDIRNLAAGDTATHTVDVPLDTCKIAIENSVVYHIPVLPAIGSDIDVVKQKNRVRVSDATSVRNEDGTSTVFLTFKNYTTTWITEENNYVQCTYYDAAGTKLGTKTIYIGIIDTKKDSKKTFEFDIPADAAEVKITNSKIVYWTEWS